MGIKMKKYNIILFHLESVSHNVLNMYQNVLPNIKKFRENCIDFEKYYSTATSTYMVIGDIVYEDVGAYEKAHELEKIFHIKNEKVSIWDYLKEMGYQIGIFLNGIDKDELEMGVENFLYKNGGCVINDDDEKFMERFSNLVYQKEKFAGYIVDDISHITYSGRRSSYGTKVRDKYVNRFIALDTMFGKVMSILGESGRLSDTVVILYGDHGDSLWGHGLCGGYLHAILPYNEMVHCPLFCKIPDKEAYIEDRILNTKDIRKLMLCCIDGDFSFEEFKREYVFSRNLYASQPLNKNVFIKGYGINNVDYTLLVSCRGLEMYINTIDSLNQMNILEFFKIKNEKIELRKIYNYILSGHYHAVMTSMTVQDIKEEFCFLYAALKKEVENIYQMSDRSVKEMRMDKIFYSKILPSDKAKLLYNALLIWGTRLYGTLKRVVLCRSIQIKEK